MRRKGLKEIILTVEALEEGHLPSHCVLMLNSVTAEMPDPVRIRLQSGREKWMVRKNGILAGKIRARAGIRLDYTNRISVFSLNQMAG